MIGMKTKMIFFLFLEVVFEFFLFSGLNENGSDNRKNENKNDKINRKRK
jgi:hypothetical protein